MDRSGNYRCIGSELSVQRVEVMMEKVKIGIIGCGGIANGKHLPAIKQLGRAEFAAFCDLIPERARKA